MKRSELRTSTTVMGQKLMSKRFSKKGEMKDWLSLMKNVRKKFSQGKEISAEERRALELARFKFEIFKGDILFDPLCSQFLAHRADKFVASTATFSALHVRKYIYPKFKSRNVYSITQKECRTFIENLKIKEFKGYEDGDKSRPIYKDSATPAGDSLKRCVKVALSLIFEYAKEEDLVGDDFINPAKFIKPRGSRKKKTSKETIVFWRNRSDIEKFIETAKNPPPLNLKGKPLWPLVMYPFCVFGLEAGPRKGELIALYNSDLSDKDGYIQVERELEEVSGEIVPRTKSGENVTRKIPFTKQMKRALSHWQKQSFFGAQSDFVFSYEDGSHLSPRMINTWFSNICTVAGIKDIGPHGMRHTFATWYLFFGGDIRELQKLLGHESITTTEVYAHIVDEMKLAQNSPVNFESKDTSESAK